MTNEDNGGRPNPFELLKKFKAKEGDRAPVLSSDIDMLSINNDFPSREAPSSGPAKIKRFRDAIPPKAQLNFRAEVSDRERFYELAQQHGYQKLGDLFKQCLDAFEEKMRK
ncbi:MULTISPECIES: hypothetical protein [Pseudomonas syringae group genomosp. 2]|uniref:hypothetical protein n=1 Tax=Pseudomonas syringae group genomosp. 2 TaxID=251698 RepID=UPI0006B967A9|nr:MULTISPECIES: hypothetical protein [Pseudomonas syringae group genomosp. 2]KPB61603.1 Stability/partitioning determinant [Pseudomonas savastanoi pv. phaseolicola]KPB66538.1 Stability/partitioning determinant [Pseudomonas amygdali pv. mellea]